MSREVRAGSGQTVNQQKQVITLTTPFTAYSEVEMTTSLHGVSMHIMVELGIVPSPDDQLVVNSEMLSTEGFARLQYFLAESTHVHEHRTWRATDGDFSACMKGRIVTVHVSEGHQMNSFHEFNHEAPTGCEPYYEDETATRFSYHQNQDDATLDELSTEQLFGTAAYRAWTGSFVPQQYLNAMAAERKSGLGHNVRLPVLDQDRHAFIAFTRKAERGGYTPQTVTNPAHMLDERGKVIGNLFVLRLTRLVPKRPSKKRRRRDARKAGGQR